MNAKQLYDGGVNFLLEHLRQRESGAVNFEALAPTATQWLQKQSYIVPRADWEKLRDAMVYAVVGYGPLEVWLKDPGISEIMVNGPDEVYLESRGSLKKA